MWLYEVQLNLMEAVRRCSQEEQDCIERKGSHEGQPLPNMPIHHLTIGAANNGALNTHSQFPSSPDIECDSSAFIRYKKILIPSLQYVHPSTLPALTVVPKVHLPIPSLKFSLILTSPLTMLSFTAFCLLTKSSRQSNTGSRTTLQVISYSQACMEPSGRSDLPLHQLCTHSLLHATSKCAAMMTCNIDVEPRQTDAGADVDGYCYYVGCKVFDSKIYGLAPISNPI